MDDNVSPEAQRTEAVQRIGQLGAVHDEDVRLLAAGLLEIAQTAMPDTYFASDTRCDLARAVLGVERSVVRDLPDALRAFINASDTGGEDIAWSWDQYCDQLRSRNKPVEVDPGDLAELITVCAAHGLLD